MENYEELEPLFQLEMPEEVERDDFDEEGSFLKHSLLYPEDKNLEILSAYASFSPFNWCNFKQAYRNISVDPFTNRINIEAIMPHQLLEDATFQNFLKEHPKDLIMVARLGFELHFGCFDYLKDVEKKIIHWFNHHIYDTTVIVDIHDFAPDSNERRIQTYNAMIVPRSNKRGNAKVYWKKGHLHHLQSHRF